MTEATKTPSLQELGESARGRPPKLVPRAGLAPASSALSTRRLFCWATWAKIGKALASGGAKANGHECGPRRACSPSLPAHADFEAAPARLSGSRSRHSAGTRPARRIGKTWGRRELHPDQPGKSRMCCLSDTPTPKSERATPSLLLAIVPMMTWKPAGPTTFPAG